MYQTLSQEEHTIWPDIDPEEPGAKKGGVGGEEEGEEDIPVEEE